MHSPNPLQTLGQPRSRVVDAVRFWEPRRIIYNIVLVAITAVWVVATWPHFRPAMTLFSLLRFSVLGILANVCYCAAYLVELPMQSLAPGTGLRRRRWLLWSAGMLLAIILTNYWIADEIYPFVVLMF